MSWGRFSIVVVITFFILLPLTPILLPLVEGIDEPLQTVLIVAVAVAIFFLVDRAFVWLVGRLDETRRPERPDEPD